MIKQYIYYLFFINAFCIYGQNQAENKNSISISIGYQSGVLKDANFSPLNYKQDGSNYALEYIRLGSNKKYILGIKANAGFSTISTNASSFFDTDLIQGQLDISYVTKIHQITSKSTLYLGGQFTSQVKSLDWEDTESFSYFAAHSIGVKVLYQYKITEKLTSEISIHSPLISLLARPPYNGINEEVIKDQDNILALITNGTIESLNAYFKVETNLKLIYALTKSLAVKASILFDYNRIYKGNDWTQFQTLTNAGLVYNF